MYHDPLAHEVGFQIATHPVISRNFVVNGSHSYILPAFRLRRHVLSEIPEIRCLECRLQERHEPDNFAEIFLFSTPRPPSYTNHLPVATHLYRTLSHFFALYGYWVVFFGVMLENAGIPMPGETVLLFAGFLAFGGQLDLGRVILTAIAGATVGDSLGYAMGRVGGTALIRKYRGHWFFPAKRFDRTQTTFLKWGHWAVFGARFITGLRILAGPFAGAFQMAYPRFLLSNFSGAVAWATVISCAGFAFGSNWERLVRLVKDTNLIVLVLLIAVVAGIVYWRARRRSMQHSD